MSIVQNDYPMNLAGRFQLNVNHFARGTYPEADGRSGALPYNRFFIPLENPAREKCWISDRDQHFTLTPGNVYFIPLNHQASVKLDQDLTFLSIQFTLELYKGVDIFSRFGKILEISGEEWQTRAIQAFEETNPFYAAAKLHALTFDFALDLMKSMSLEAWNSVTKFSEFQKELDYLQKNRNTLAAISIDDLAAVSGVCRETFSRKFSLITGISPKKFLTKILLDHACRMLINETDSIKEIAEKLGFNNEFYFSRFFRKQLGIPPGQYRNNHKKSF